MFNSSCVRTIFRSPVGDRGVRTAGSHMTPRSALDQVLDSVMLTADQAVSEQQILANTTTVGFSPGTCSYEKLGLNLSGRSVADLSAVSLFPALQIINLSSNLITSLRALTPLEQLRCLDVSHNHLTEFPDFADGVDEDQLPRLLTEINLSFNRIEIIRNDMGRLRFVAELNLKANALRSLQWCRTLVHLHKLDVSDNQISDLKGLEGAVALLDFNISNNSIVSLRLDAVLPQLRHLNASKNSIADVKGISDQIPSLAVLDLGHNQISSLTGLADLSRLDLLRDLNLKGNHVTDMDQYRNEAIFLLPVLEVLDHELLTTLEILQSEISHGKHENVFPTVFAKQCELLAAEGV